MHFKQLAIRPDSGLIQRNHGMMCPSKQTSTHRRMHMKTVIKTVIGLFSLALLTPALVQAQEAKLFYAQGHTRTDSHKTVIVVSDDDDDDDDRHRRRGRGHNEYNNGHNNGHHVHYRGCGHYEHGNGHGYGHVSGHHDGHHRNRHYQGHHYQRHDSHHGGHGTHGTGHHYNAGPEIERVYVNPQLFR